MSLRSVLLAFVLIISSEIVKAKTYVEVDVLAPFGSIAVSTPVDFLGSGDYSEPVPIQLRVGRKFEKLDINYSFISRSSIEINGKMTSSSGYSIWDDLGDFQGHVFRAAYDVYQNIYFGVGLGHYSYSAELEASSSSTTAIIKEDFSASRLGGELFISYNYDISENLYWKGELNYILSGAGSASVSRSEFDYEVDNIGRGYGLLFLLGYSY